MKPRDENAKLPVEERPFRLLIISGSQRRQYNCQGVAQQKQNINKDITLQPKKSEGEKLRINKYVRNN